MKRHHRLALVTLPLPLTLTLDTPRDALLDAKCGYTLKAMARYPSGGIVTWQCPRDGGSIAGSAVCRDGQWIPQPECKIFVNLCCHN